MNPIPRFATNRPDQDETVAGAIQELFSELRTNLQQPPTIAIATAFINPGGFSLIADELVQAPRVRLLLGAEPDEDVTRAIEQHDPDSAKRLEGALGNHASWLGAERDAMGFTRLAIDSAKEMVEWLESLDSQQRARVDVRRYTRGFLHGKAFIAESALGPQMLVGSSNMTYAGLARNAELNLGGDHDQVLRTVEWFEHYWQASEPYDLAGLYKDQWKPYSPWEVFNRMLYELYGNTLDDAQPFTSALFELTSFQRDGVRRMLRLLDELGGVLVADEVGLGKSFMAGEIIRAATQDRKQRVLILAPASIVTSMWRPFLEKYNFSRWAQVMSFDKLRANLSEDSDELESTLRMLEEPALVVIDEAHNLRNISAQRSLAVERAILHGGRKKVVLLTATPVNNSLMDLNSLLRYFIRNDAQFANLNIPSIKQYLKNAQSIDPEALRPEHLFDLMDQVAVKRTRKFIKENYKNDKIRGADGTMMVVEFPDPHPYKIEYTLDDQGLELVGRMVKALHIPDGEGKPKYEEVKHNPDQLILARYLSSLYRKDEQLEGIQIKNAGLLRSALLKRLESSPHALVKSLERLVASHKSFLNGLTRGFVFTGSALTDWSEFTSSGDGELDDFLAELDEDDAQSAETIDNFHSDALIDDVRRDIVLLESLEGFATRTLRAGDRKFERLLVELEGIAADARKPDPSQRGRSDSDRRKIIIFSTFADTVVDIHERLTEALKHSKGTPLHDYAGRLASPVMGSEQTTKAKGGHGGVSQDARAHVLEGFAPKTIGMEIGGEFPKDRYDILVTTDVLAEGVNLQQAGRIINYDLPWNPMRIVQRHGRVDRIGSPHPSVELGLFFPAEMLNELLGLETTIRRKVAQAEAAVGAVGLSLFSNNPDLEVNLADANQAVNQFKDLLVNRGATLAQSGEEYRKRLEKYLQELPAASRDLDRLPMNIGSGFRNPRISHNGYVFCLRMSDHPQPWFRYVETDADWVPVLDNAGQPQISHEVLTSLVVADPLEKGVSREMSDLAYDRAFDAWILARSDAHAQWMNLTDPANFDPKTPKAFKDAKRLVQDSGSHLTTGQQENLLLRLQSVPTTKVERSVGAVLKGELSHQAKIDRVIELLDQSGIEPNPKPKPLPPIAPNQIHLVAWMAVQGSRETDSPVL